MVKKLVGKKGKQWSWRLISAGLVLPLAGSLIFGGYYFKKYQDLKKQPISADRAAQAESDRVLKEVGQLYDLPKGEKPSVSYVADVNKLPEQLKNQPFFAGAQNGDYAIIYTNAKLAILYRPSAHKLIRVNNVTVQSTPVVRVIGAANDRQAAEKALSEAKITNTDGSDAKGSYTGVTVVDLTGQNAELAQNIANTLHGKVGGLPDGEDKPDKVDILVIAGAAEQTP